MDDKVKKEKQRIKELTQKHQKKMVSTQNRIAREVDNMLDTHQSIKKQFFAPTEEQISHFEEDIPTFLEHYAQTGNITAACKKTKKLNSKAVQFLRVTEPTFKDDFEIASKIFATKLEDEARDRAINGTKTPTIFKGEHITDVDMPDNRLLETLLKAETPEKFDRKSLDRIEGHDRPQVNVQIINFNDSEADSEDNPRDMGEVIDVTDDGRVIRKEEKQ